MTEEESERIAELDEIDRLTQVRLMAYNGHRGSFPRVLDPAGVPWSRDRRAQVQAYVSNYGWLVSDRLGGGDGIPFRYLRWTRERIRANTWDRPGSGELVQLFP